MIRLALVALLLGGCVVKNDARYCDASRPCNDSAFPNCDFVKHECESGGMADGGDGADLSVLSCSDSSSCPADAPVCSDGVCGPCNGDNTACASFHGSTPVCAASGGCVECVANTDCGNAATPYCGPANSCVECLTSSNCTPKICNATNMCVACQANSDCGSGICDTSSGTCVDPAQIYLVDNGGMTIAACEAARPTRNGQTPSTAYCDISEGASGGTRAYALVTGHGATFPYSPFAPLVPRVYVGPGYKAAMPAVVAGATTATAIVTMSGVSSVTIDGFEINGGDAKDGITCNSTKSTAPHNVLIVKNSYIHNTNSNAGIYPVGCDLVVDSSRVATAAIRAVDDTSSQFTTSTTLTNSQFDSATADGVDINGILTMDRCRVINNSAANGNGLQLNTSNFTVTNSFFYNNDVGVSFLGNGPTAIFKFNTVAFNRIGVGCAQNTIEASIYVHNMDGALVGGTAAGTCKTVGVVTDSAGTPQPVFVDTTSPTSYDFRLATDTQAHLTANQACCIDQVKGPLDGGTSLPDHDFFGTMRPLGAGYDIGAHEAK